MDNNKPEFAAVLLQYLDGARRDEYVAQIRHARGNLGAKLAALERKGLWGISYVSREVVEKRVSYNAFVGENHPGVTMFERKLDLNKNIYGLRESFTCEVCLIKKISIFKINLED